MDPAVAIIMDPSNKKIRNYGPLQKLMGFLEKMRGSNFFINDVKQIHWPDLDCSPLGPSHFWSQI